jgi:hypothetical protein
MNPLLFFLLFFLHLLIHNRFYREGPPPHPATQHIPIPIATRPALPRHPHPAPPRGGWFQRIFTAHTVHAEAPPGMAARPVSRDRDPTAHTCRKREAGSHTVGRAREYGSGAKK